tara:strand:+ start:505 stop:630 length:126 start_codon:yes stop_codon:yes gene_type:complete
MIKFYYDPILGCTGWEIKRPKERSVEPNRKKRNKKQKNGKR